MASIAYRIPANPHVSLPSRARRAGARGSLGARVGARIGATLALWRQRARERAAIAWLNDRELHDIGLTRADVAFEANKPFWRA